MLGNLWARTCARTKHVSNVSKHGCTTGLRCAVARIRNRC